MSGGAAIYVAHREDGTWLVGAPEFTDADPSELLRVSFEELLKVDASLSDMGDLAVGHFAMRRDQSEPWSFGVVPVGPIFLVRYDARPSPSHPERDEWGGAIVNCWLVAESMDAALVDSAQHLEASDWVIVDTLFREQTAVEEFDHNQYVRQARFDGLVAVFHTYPKDELELN
jgi:hypothetical protein